MHNPENIKAVQFSQIIGIDLNNLRVWRSRGITLGKEVSRNRYEYDRLDILEGFLIKHLHEQHGIGLIEAARMVHWIAPHIAAHIVMPQGNILPPFPDAPARFSIFAPSQNPILTNDPARLVDLDSTMVFAFDLARLAKELPDKVWLYCTRTQRPAEEH